MIISISLKKSIKELLMSLILFMFFLPSCMENSMNLQSKTSTSQSINSDLFFPSDSCCKKCDIGILKTTEAQLDSLTFKTMHSFLWTFDSSCSNNVEFSQWSNELLFKVIFNSPLIFLEIAESGQVDNELIVTVIQNSSYDNDLQSIYNKLKSTKGNFKTKKMYLQALIIASEKEGQKIVE